MVYFIVIAIVLFVGSGIGVGFWISSEKGKRYAAERKADSFQLAVERWRTACTDLEFVVIERDKEIKRLQGIISNKIKVVDKLYLQLAESIGFDALDTMIKDIKDEVL